MYDPRIKHRTEEDRQAAFWSKVDKSGGPEACWPWTGYRTPTGYGQTCVRQRHVYAHRQAYELTRGAPQHSVLHKCDNRGCCNPAHLYEGTQKENMREMIERGRSGDRRNFGEANGRAKLTDHQVSQIREEYTSLKTRQVDLAARFGVTQGQISAIVRGAQR